jgi:predicted ATP-grasp superfamily ATP-dependent carboligase
MPTYGGTLGAVRCLGRLGVPVVVAGRELLASSRWSRHTTRFVRCPPAEESDRFVAWLLDFGRREPGHVLYPTSDDLAWLFAAHAPELEKHFFTYQPPVETVVRLLDKRSLYAACEAVGIATVPSWFPADEDEVRARASGMAFPLLIKARTQALRVHQTKGTVVPSRDALLDHYRAFVAQERYRPGIERHFSAAARPFLQQFLPRASQAVWSVTGFVDRSGELFAARCAVKVMQRTLPVGLGLCFEARELPAELAEGAKRLCRSVGYFGVFEIEFLREGGRFMAIDFNPRFYGQMGFEAPRGLPQAAFAWLAASGQHRELRRAVLAAAAPQDGTATAYAHRFVFELLLLARTLGGRLPPAERRLWKDWYARHRPTLVDASADPGDRLPGLVHSLAELMSGGRAVLRAQQRR